MVLDRLNSHTVSRFRPFASLRVNSAKDLSRSAARCFPIRCAQGFGSRGVYPERSEWLSMTELDLSVDEELSRAFEPCLRFQTQPCLGLAGHNSFPFDVTIHSECSTAVTGTLSTREFYAWQRTQPVFAQFR